MRLTVRGPSPPLRGDLRLPGDKSITHRALLLAGMASGASRLRGLLRAGVTEAMLAALRCLGVDAEFLGPDDLLVLGGAWRSPEAPLDCGNSGTTMRLLLGALAGRPVTATLTGSRRLRQRPMARVVEPLRRMGADIRGNGPADAPPFTVHGRHLRGAEHHLPVASAQVKSALLLAGLHAEGPTVVVEPGLSRDHTERLLAHLGLALTVERDRVRLVPDDRPLPAFDLRVPGDFSSAAFLLVAGALVPGSRVRLEGVGLNPRRLGLLEALREMGAQVETEVVRLEAGEPVGCVAVTGGGLRATVVEGERAVRMIDEFPVFAVAATQAEGETVVRGAQELRHKESDRIQALAVELRKLGACIEPTADGFIVHGPRRLRGAVVDSHGDHRLAMALAVAGLVAEGETVVEGAEWIGESYPGFAHALRALGAEVT